MKAPCQTIPDFPVQFPDGTRNFPVRGRREFSRNGAGITVLCPRDRFAKQCYRGGAHCSLYGTSLCQAQQNIQLSINNIHRERRWSFKCCITESAASSDISLSAAF